MFHLVCRPEEIMTIHLSDITILDCSMTTLYPDVYGIVRIRHPKTSRTPGHAQHQYSTILDPGLARWLASAIDDLRGFGPELWPHGYPRFVKVWDYALKCLKLADVRLTPAGLRGGGATHDWLRTRDLPALRRRGRWNREATLERYLQEGVFYSEALRRQTEGSLVFSLALLAPAIFDV